MGPQRSSCISCEVGIEIFFHQILSLPYWIMYIITFCSPATFVCVGSTRQQLTASPSLHHNQFSAVPSQSRCCISLVCITFSQTFPFSEFSSLFSVTFTSTLQGGFSSPARSLQWSTILGPVFCSQSLSLTTLSLGPAASPDTTMSFNVAFAFYPVLLSILSSPWRTGLSCTSLPVLSHLSTSHQWAASPHKAVRSWPHLLSKCCLTCMGGGTPLSFSPPFGSQLSSAFPWETSSPSQSCPGPYRRPLSFSAQAASPPAISHKCWCTGCPPLLPFSVSASELSPSSPLTPL